MKNKKKKEFDPTSMNFEIKPIEIKPFKFDGAKFARDLDEAINRIGKGLDTSIDKNKTIKEIIQDFKQSSK